MEDDGLLLNFSTSASPRSKKAINGAKPTPKEDRGSWRERREASKRRYEESKAAARAAGPRQYDSDHPVKRHKVEDKAHAGPREALSNPSHANGGGFVSSLFTSNPQISQASSSEHPQTSAESTNAPMVDLSVFSVNPMLQTFLSTKLGLSAPTRIQARAVPEITKAFETHRDVVMVAQTGSGKTLAYLLPIINKLMTSGTRIDRQSGVFAVILAPTRELALQIYRVCEDLCRVAHYIVPGLVVGGEKKKSEKARLRKGVNILIGTPGRMADHVDNTARLSLGTVENVVLDEGDRLIDMGFEETLTQILSKIPTTRTTVLCSATMNAQASRLKTLALSEPVSWVRDDRDSGDEERLPTNAQSREATPGQLIQKILMVPAKLRLVTLAALVKAQGHRRKKGVVFFSCTDSVDFHTRVFESTKFTPVFKLHGSMSQQQRSETMQAFVKSDHGILFTTDVASRGLDVTVDEVVEYDPPFTIEDHLHRAGRTARAGRRGEASMFLLPSEKDYELKLRDVHPGGISVEGYQSALQRGFGFGEWRDSATSWQLSIEKGVISDGEGIATLARNAFTASIRAYTTHSHAEKTIFNLRELHLGHVAKAFALRETPKTIMTPGSTAHAEKKKKKKSTRDAMLEAAERQMGIGEYNIY